MDRPAPSAKTGFPQPAAALAQTAPVHSVSSFFAGLWCNFEGVAPRAAAIRAALEARGERVENDHVAFRTFNRCPVDLDALEPLLLGLGYQALQDYEFPDKHLRARAYIHPQAPRIFLSELIREQLSQPSQALLEEYVRAIELDPARSLRVFTAGRLWPAPRFSDYERLGQESEYAAWLLALGLRPNHFTVSVNALGSLQSVEAVLSFVESAGYAVNQVGGRVKGSKELCLEQGATLADRFPVGFADGEHPIPTCYYEFALRHQRPDGTLFQGFVEGNAKHIFESTNRDRAPERSRET